VNPAVTSGLRALDLSNLCHFLMERSPVPTAELEGVGHVIRYVNPAFCRLEGKSPEALIGKPFAETVQEGGKCLVLLDRVYRTGEAETHTESAYSEPHPTYWSYAMWPVLGTEQRPVGVMMQVTETTLFHQQMVEMNEALLRSSVRQHELTEAAEKLNDQLQLEITARKQAEEALARQAAALQRSNEELQQFAHIVAHDLQEPLRVVSTYAQFLAQQYQGKLDAEADTFIGYMVDGAARGRALIRDVLLFSQVEGQAQEFTEINSEEVFTHTLNVLCVAVEESGAAVTHDPLPAVRADASQLGQVFQNLLSNALKFRGATPPRIHVSARREDRQWEFAVRDNGIGIEPRHAGQIFQLFRRLHTRGKYPGTGAGLAICKKIIERHGGRIWVESTPGQGTTFFFTLPVPKRERP
jgi:signal transduction histidine kinase